MTKLAPGQTDELSDFRTRALLGVAVTGIALLSPFAVNNFVQGRTLLGVGSLAIVVVLLINAGRIVRGRGPSPLLFVALVPTILFFLFLAYERQGIIGALWSYPALIVFYFVLPERQAWISNVLLLAMAVPQSWRVLEHPVAARVAVTLLTVSVFTMIFVRVISRQQERLGTLAATDALTGLANRTLLGPTLEQAIAHGTRNGTPMTVLAIDLDHFKAINDTRGHDAGDAVLRGVGTLLRGRLRGADRVFRLGGEEFLALLYETDGDAALRVAEELRGAISALPLLPDRTVTASFGVATHDAGEAWPDWIKRADARMYRAKALGRNRVMT